jgi:FixJ family two-component response regulator
LAEQRRTTASASGGLSRREVDLGLDQRTIEMHRQRVMEKMHAESLAPLVRMTSEVGGIGKLLP